MKDTRVFVMDNDSNIYHINRELVGEWNKWKYFEDEGILELTHKPKDAVKVDFVDCFHQSDFEFILA